MSPLDAGLLEALPCGQTDRIADAVERLRKDFDQPLRIDSLARELGMSVSASTTTSRRSRR